MSVYDNYPSRMDGDKYRIQYQACFSHFNTRYNSFLEQKEYVMAVKISDYLSKKESNTFIKHFLRVFGDKVKVVPMQQCIGQPFVDLPDARFVVFKIEPKDWPCYAAFNFFGSTLRLMDEYPGVVKSWYLLHKKHPRKFDFFQKLWFAHLCGGTPNGHNLFDYGFIYNQEKHKKDQVTTEKVLNAIKTNSFPFQKDPRTVYIRCQPVGINCTFLKEKEIPDGYMYKSKWRALDAANFNHKVLA